MNKPSNVSHPLKNRTGTSQRTRIIAALDTATAPIDGKTMADRLYLISKYARHVNFYEYDKNEIDGEFQKLGDWASFFKESLPFQLAVLSKTVIEDIESQFILLSNELKANPSQQALESMLNFIFNELVLPPTRLYDTILLAENSFGVTLLSILKSSFLEPLKSFIALYNSSITFLCVCKRNFTDFMTEPWELKVDEVYAIDLFIKKVKKGKKEAFVLADEKLNALFFQMLSGLQDIVAAAPKYIDESLLPLKESLQKKHQPHLALLFTFLELFAHFQGNINELSKEHLDFFYQHVLKMIPKKAVPDKANMIFEIAKHLEEYPLPKGLLLKDGKDSNKQDIQFGLDHEIVLDKAQIKELRTLSLNPISANDVEYIEGVYIAPIANTADGIEKGFKEDQSKNWPTLGAKYSRCTLEGEEIPKEHPEARLGFVLASPVLLMEEGKRVIEVRLNCGLPVDAILSAQEIKIALEEIAAQEIIYFNAEILLECSEKLGEETLIFLTSLLDKNGIYEIGYDLKSFLFQKDPLSCVPIFNDEEKAALCECLINQKKRIDDKHLFNISFSGEKDWVIPKPEKIEILAISTPPFPTEPQLPELPTEGDIQFMFRITLEEDDPKIVFFDTEKLKEKIEIKTPFPLVKIELNSKIKKVENTFSCNKLNKDESINEDRSVEKCCFKKVQKPVQEIEISPYHYLNGLILEDAHISVKVCGVKNLIVQNDENLQDVNKPMFPFGPRPKVDAAFVIGSKEVFCKNWQSFRVGVEWKDRPEDFAIYYEAYNLEDDVDIDNDVFELKAGVLDEGDWKENGVQKKVFGPKDSFPECPPVDTLFYFNGYTWDRTDFPVSAYEVKSMPLESLTPLTVNSRKAFFRIRLREEDFQHDSYAFVLAKQMMALANIIDAKSAERVRDDLRLLQILSNRALTLMTSIINTIEFVVDHIDTLNDIEIPALLSFAESIRGDLNFVTNNYNHVDSPGRVTNALSAANSIITEIGTIFNPPAPSILGQINHIKDDLELILGFIDPTNGTNISDNDVDNNLNDFGLQIVLVDIKRRIIRITDLLDIDKDVKLPNEPYTPTIKSLFVDYRAIATKEDMEIIHLYPYENTSKFENIEDKPTLLPCFKSKEDEIIDGKVRRFLAEGILYIGLENVTTGGSLSILFQLAEATADSESDRAEINWSYLSNNTWTELRPGFDVISDGTDGLTVSGIVNIAVPDSISKIGNTVMPDTLYWIKVSTTKNVKAIAETIGIHTQAARASANITELNDTNRLETALPAGSVSKLVEGDFSVKKVEQLYDSFEGRKPEVTGHFYTRVSEHLKHKGKGIMINDYEKIVLEEFPQIYKAKCISHTMGLSANLYRRDLEIAPGFLVVAVIPDLTKLKSGGQLEPKAPVSLLEKIGDYLREKTSAFARLKIMNPRYEHVDVGITVRLYRGKSQNFYAKKLKEDITLFLAPWFLGDSEKLAFGQVVFFSDIVGFVEQLDYVDFIVDLVLSGECGQTGSVIKPLTARSILTGGTICVEISEEDCNDGERIIGTNVLANVEVNNTK